MRAGVSRLLPPTLFLCYLRIMDDWIKHARDIQEQEEAKKRKEQQEAKSRISEILESEKDWMERVQNRIQKIRGHGLLIKADRNPAGLSLSCKGAAEIQYLSPMNFSVRFHNVYPSSRLVLSHPITVHHHRVVRVREMNEHNIEEILKFVSLGMDNYMEIATYDRLERNLENILESINEEEHIKGEL